MSELKNPLFESERELLERQKEEYKNALMGDVAQIKTQSQEIGKKVAIAGGVLLAGVLLSRMFGSSKKKSKKLKKAPLAMHVGYNASADYEPAYQHYNPMSHEQEHSYMVAAEGIHPAQPYTAHQTGVSKSFLNSELVQMLTSQLAALLMVYLTKKIEEYLSSVSKNTDIAAIPIEVSNTEATAYYYPEEDAI